MKISYSFGIIDLFHFGHLNALKRAGQNADLHIFGLVGDKAAEAWLGGIVSNEEERRAVLESISYVDRIMVQETLDPTENLKAIHREYPDAVITLYHGNDWAVVPAEQYLKSIGGNVQIFDYYERLSPIRILQALNSRVSKPLQYRNLISTKANTLMALKDRLKYSRIEDIAVFTIGQYKSDMESVCSQIHEKFGDAKIVIRSSSKNEDCFENSNAGHYESVLNIHASDRESIIGAFALIERSYEKDGIVDEDEQILVQTQTENVLYSGVVFTREIQRNRPYYVINYDDDGGTDSVTSGIGGKVIWIAHDCSMEHISLEWQNLIKSIREIEELLKGTVLDIEFAINKDGETIIFQVRPLAANYKFKRDTTGDKLLDVKNKAMSQFEEYRREGIRILSDMAFWNPSEIIGDNPKNLDYSLYRELITKRAWSIGLAPLGYRLVDKDLMYKLGNKPYICVDYAFMALIPASVEDAVADKLLNYYRKKLFADFTAHDKIEFEIVLSCFDFDIDDRLRDLTGFGFSLDEILQLRKALKDLTVNGISSYQTILKEDLKALEQLETVRQEVETAVQEKQDISIYVEGIKRLIKALNLFGTPQFSRQARFAFIARALCNSLVHKQYITELEYNLFMSTIETVATEFERDFGLFLSAKMSSTDFYNKYGHLRAGTYDIRSKRYDQLHFSIKGKNETVSKSSPMKMSLPVKSIERALTDFDLDFSYDIFTGFLKEAFEQREMFKFIFTKSLSLAIEIIVSMGEKIGINRNDLSYLEVPQILSADLFDSERELKEFWNMIISERRDRHNINSDLILPEVITNIADFNFIKIEEARPNFVTEKVVTGDVVLLEEETDQDITNKIVVIEKADPGFDWIFTKNIMALITKYGGVASHMAIRCAEFEIPAAIGCGEKIYNDIKESSRVKLDCKNKKIVKELQ